MPLLPYCGSRRFVHRDPFSCVDDVNSSAYFGGSIFNKRLNGLAVPDKCYFKIGKRFARQNRTGTCFNGERGPLPLRQEPEALGSLSFSLREDPQPLSSITVMNLPIKISCSPDSYSHANNVFVSFFGADFCTSYQPSPDSCRMPVSDPG